MISVASIPCRNRIIKGRVINGREVLPSCSSGWSRLSWKGCCWPSWVARPPGGAKAFPQPASEVTWPESISVHQALFWTVPQTCGVASVQRALGFVLEIGQGWPKGDWLASFRRSAYKTNVSNGVVTAILKQTRPVGGCAPSVETFFLYHLRQLEVGPPSQGESLGSMSEGHRKGAFSASPNILVSFVLNGYIDLNFGHTIG